MELQVAMDFGFTIEKAEKLIISVQKAVDVVEIGTPLIMECGMEPVRRLKERFPEKKILADLKIVDAGYYEAKAAFAEGADIVTVLAVSDNSTILNAIEAAREFGKKILVDMLSVPNLPERLKEIDTMDVDYICLHTSKDLQKINSDASVAFEQLKKLVKKTKLALAGGINSFNIKKYASIRPDLIIVGEGISGTENPAKEADYIKKIMKQCEI